MSVFGRWFAQKGVPGRRSMVWAILDTLSQRGGAAFVLLVVSWAANPSVVGQISAATIALTLYIALLEAPIRQTAHRVVKTGTEGNRALTVLALKSGVIGSSVVMLLIWLLHELDIISDLYPLLGLGLAPLITSAYLVRMIRIQSMGGWRTLGMARACSVMVSLLLSVFLVLRGSPEAAVVVQVLVGEILFASVVFCTRVAAPVKASAFVRDSFRRDLVGTAALSVFGWLRGQSDRLALLVVVPSSVLGLYSLSYAVARAPAEAAVAGAINSLRAALAAGPGNDFQYINSTFGSTVKKFTVICAVLFVFSCTLCLLLYVFVLGPEWHYALSAVPLFASSIYASSFSSSVNALLNHLGLSSRSYRVQLLEIVIGICIGLAFLLNFRVGVVSFVAREVVASLLLYYAVRRFVKIRTSFIWILPFAISFLAGLASIVFFDAFSQS
ncbi:hypothetical protein [Rhodococcoides fascians]|uniref:hypothetical protein n=1 Tax=Rhodococcoides fascians TaxID=1828 RepID=UPI0007AAD7D5|nr:hypothetical protein [Rhodococcus fascians]AMY52597.1 hypothetical protein A3L23_01246 [Rhodococcus fascians D188]